MSREGRDAIPVDAKTLHSVSTHASREGRDLGDEARATFGKVSTHASREERDQVDRPADPRNLFQLTRPAKNATVSRSPYLMVVWFQLTRPAKNATFSAPRKRRAVFVSTHASREERDAAGVRPQSIKMFQLTRPAKNATKFFIRKIYSEKFQLTRPAKNATVYQESTDMITLSGRVCATVRGGVGLMGLCGAEAREFTGAVRCADIWGFLCELGVRASVLHKRRRLTAASLRRFYMA